MSDVSLNFSGDSSHDDGAPKMVEISIPKKTVKRVVKKDEKTKSRLRGGSVPKEFRVTDSLNAIEDMKTNARPMATPPKYKQMIAVRGKSPAPSSRPPTGTRSPSVRSHQTSVPDERPAVFNDEEPRGRSPPTDTSPQMVQEMEARWIKAHNEKIDLQNELQETRRQRDTSASQASFIHARGQDMLKMKDMEIHHSHLVNEDLAKRLAKTEAEEKDTTKAYEYEKNAKNCCRKVGRRNESHAR